MIKLSEIVKYNIDGLIPVIVQEYETNQILTLAYANKEAIENTLNTGKATFFSRSRNKLWCKGEVSGNYQKIIEIKIDCDNDTLIYVVKFMGLESACHTGHKSCFYTTYENNELIENDTKLYFSPDLVYKK